MLCKNCLELILHTFLKISTQKWCALHIMSEASRETMTKKLTQLLLRTGLASLLICSPHQLLLASDFLLSEEDEQEEEAEEPYHPISTGHCINFNDVPAIEFIRFVSKISSENFIYDSRDLNFNISLSTGKGVSEEMVVAALIQLLQKQGLTVAFDAGYYVIHKSEVAGDGQELLAKAPRKTPQDLLASNSSGVLAKDNESYEFFVYKLQYHEGPEIEEALKKIAADLRNQPEAPIQSDQRDPIVAMGESDQFLALFRRRRDLA